MAAHCTSSDCSWFSHSSVTACVSDAVCPSTSNCGFVSNHNLSSYLYWHLCTGNAITKYFKMRKKPPPHSEIVFLKFWITAVTTAQLKKRIDLHEVGQNGVLAIITKWLDLGAGRTMPDPKWWSHLCRICPRHQGFSSNSGWIYDKSQEDKAFKRFKPGSIYEAFKREQCLGWGPLPPEVVD